MLSEPRPCRMSTARLNKHEKLEKYHGVKEELEIMWKVKVTQIYLFTGTLGVVRTC